MTATRTVPLDASVSAVFDATGDATASLGPTTYGTTWEIQGLSTSSDSTDECELRVFKNNPNSAGSMVLNTFAGNADSSAGDNIVLRFGERLHFVWSNGTPNARATGVIFGVQRGR